MPEGHTIHRIARQHGALLEDRALRVTSPQGRFAGDAARVDGAVLERIEPYGKHLFYHWSTGEVGHVHLGLFGTFRVHLGPDAPPPYGAVRMRLATDSATIDLSGPTACSIGTVDDRAAILARLGPDPLLADADGEQAVANMRRSARAIGAVLLDQRVLAGIGNVYRAEVLFVHGIHPSRPGTACTIEELGALWETVRSMLHRGARAGRIVTVDRREVKVPRGRLRRGDGVYVYHRDTCHRCGAPVATVALGGRPCYYCTAEQTR